MTTTMTPCPPRTDARSTQLIASSERMTLDPFTEIDWSIAIDDSAYHLPPEWLPLYGTSIWDAMDDAARITYSRHECSALFGAGIWFENQLMQLVLQHLVDVPVTSPAHRYLLIEIADECRHSTMFGEYIRRADTPAYGPAGDTATIELGNRPGERVLGYLLILAVEELLDATNRATMKDERIHPVARQISKLHVLEEARHVSFAKTYLAEVWPDLDRHDQEYVRSTAATAVAYIASRAIDPAVYRTLGIDDGYDTVRANPHYNAQVTNGLSKLTDFLTAIDVIDDTVADTWRELGMIA